MPEFGGMRNFNPQVHPLNVAGRSPSLSGGAIRGVDGNAVVVPAWNPQVPLVQGQQQPGVSQLGDMNHPRGAQSVPMAGQQQQRPVAQAQPQYQQQYQPQMAGAEENHNFAVQAQGRNGQIFTANLSVPFPAGSRIVGVLPPRAPQYQMGGQEESHIITLRGIGRDNREILRDIEVTFPAGVSTPSVAETF